MKNTVSTRCGHTILIDEEDYEKVSQYTWFLWGEYPCAKINNKSVRLHRWLLHCDDPNECVDHINQDKFDARKNNLRIISKSHNAHNVARKTKSKSGFRGVTFEKRTGRYFARLAGVHLGTFNTAEQAAACYDKACSEKFDSAHINNVSGEHSTSRRDFKIKKKTRGYIRKDNDKYYPRLRYKKREYHLEIQSTHQKAQQTIDLKFSELQHLELSKIVIERNEAGIAILKSNCGTSILVDDDVAIEFHNSAIQIPEDGYPQLKNKDLHLHVLPSKEGFVVDHINRSKIDARRINLRYATRSQNNANKARPENTHSNYQGVTRTSDGIWRAKIMENYKNIDIGRYHEEIMAATAYDIIAKHIRGTFAILNNTGVTRMRYHQNNSKLECSVEEYAAFLIPHVTSEIKQKVDTSSPYYGVTREGTGWRSAVYHNHETHKIGTFQDEESAARAYDIANKQYVVKQKS